MKQRSYYWSDPTGMWLMVEHWLGDDGAPRAAVICGCLGQANEWVDHFRQELPFKSDDDPLPGDFGTGELKPGGVFPFVYHLDRGHLGYLGVELWTPMGTEPLARFAVAIDSRIWEDSQLLTAAGVNKLGVRVHLLAGAWTHENHVPAGLPSS